MAKTYRILTLSAVFVSALTLSACSKGDDSATQTAATPATEAATVTVVMQTSAGEIVLELDATNAPVTTSNFVTYVEDEFYDGLIFHRVIDGFMIQGGGFDADMTQQPVRAPIRNESNNGLSNSRGTIAMARTQAPDSATAQFYINLVDNNNLDYRNGRPGYAVFGRVISGMEVVDSIAKVRTGNRGMHQNVPNEDIVIESVRLQQQ
ncbi:peptidylprolyl isomerase [Salinispirillum sp. LH 10-3-1]|uniref:Peptidyl-prolyl cis-trans isomerase n=1 Tax=Salinispirillum sp. LH 10-3-1 TaxID=2952525 RepID=A0AB38YD25_9GAMM